MLKIKYENKTRIVVVIYLIFAYLAVGAIYCYYNLSKQIFDFVVLGCDSEVMFLATIYTFLAVLPLLKKIGNENKSSCIEYEFTNKSGIFYLVLTALLIGVTTYLVLENSYGVLGYHNSESSFKIAGINTNIRELVIPCLIYGFITFKNRSLTLNLIMLLLYLIFIYTETVLRYTKGPLIGSIIILFYLLNNSRINIRYILIFILLITSYTLGYEIISSLRTGILNTEIYFLKNIYKIIDRFTGYPDLYIIYTNINEAIGRDFSNSSMSTADYYKEEILGLPTESFHGQATGLFGFALLNFGIIGGGVFVFIFSTLIRLILVQASKISNITMRVFVNIILFIEIIPAISDGNFKIIGLTSSGLLRGLGIIFFLILLNFFTKKYCKKIKLS